MKHLFSMWRWLLLLGLLAMGRFSAHAHGGSFKPMVPCSAGLSNAADHNGRLPL